MSTVRHETVRGPSPGTATWEHSGHGTGSRRGSSCSRLRPRASWVSSASAAATFMVASNLAGWYGSTTTSPLFLFPFAAILGGVAQFTAGDLGVQGT